MDAVHPGSTPTRAPSRVPVSPAGHVVGALVNLVVLYLVNVAPGWQTLPFLTDATPRVLGLVNAALWVSAAAEAVYVVRGTGPVRAAGEVVTTLVGLGATLRVWAVFPFELSEGWHLLVRGLLVVALVGSAIGILVALGRLVGALVGAVARR
ncbi:hypothetical protein H9L10_15360 [Phycicoccus endophyticus]|uniref:Uncharacterized protein n=1 Tax=Phycicoccus endophyticus TaxID=1690220 RepID=A0A7G9R1Q5_9MICO|nr:hypothetical protein [Phycicoccus endophyticus]NHI18678.1 hypothetical protein [Phycicoccus endophyticus]QNN49530.1 hypothetical protein H9L10_15360 [Phycicoccus endophyticus]GGL37305.1 hypothetical protein GCM10012283_19870 [Phycicoccus endophyticus]